MLKLFGKLIVLPLVVILLALSLAVSILSRIHYLVAILVNVIFILCAMIALFLHQWQNFGIAVLILVISWILMKIWNVIEYGMGIMCGGSLNYFCS